MRLQLCLRQPLLVAIICPYTNYFSGKHTSTFFFYTSRDVATRMRHFKLTQLTYMPKGTCYENLYHLPWVLCDSRSSCTFVMTLQSICWHSCFADHPASRLFLTTCPPLHYIAT